MRIETPLSSKWIESIQNTDIELADTVDSDLFSTPSDSENFFSSVPSHEARFIEPDNDLDEILDSILDEESGIDDNFFEESPHIHNCND